MLTEHDVVELVNNRSPEVRAAIAEKVCKQYISESLSERERSIANDIFRLLMRDMEVRIRLTLSQNLKDSAEIPHDIAVSLAHDVETVAIPMLECSTVLTDDDMIAIIGNQQLRKILAISHRKNISPRLFDELMATGNSEVAKSLFANHNVNLSEEEFSSFINKYADNEVAIKALINRVSLPVVVVEKLMSSVSEAITAELKSTYSSHAPEIDETTTYVLEMSTLSMVNRNTSGADVEGLVRHLHSMKRLSPSMLLSALCLGQISFFVSGLARLAGIPTINAKVLFSDRTGSGFRSLFLRAGMPECLYNAVALVTVIIEEAGETQNSDDPSAFSQWLMKELQSTCETSTTEYLVYLLAIVRKNLHFHNKKGVTVN